MATALQSVPSLKRPDVEEDLRIVDRAIEARREMDQAPQADRDATARGGRGPARSRIKAEETEQRAIAKVKETPAGDPVIRDARHRDLVFRFYLGGRTDDVRNLIPRAIAAPGSADELLAAVLTAPPLLLDHVLGPQHRDDIRARLIEQRVGKESEARRLARFHELRGAPPARIADVANERLVFGSQVGR